jgi:septum formation protein
MIRLTVPLVLASQSPRRRELLHRLGLTFEVDPSHVEEIVPEGTAPAEVVEALARQKAEAVAARHPDALVLGADTIVVLDGDILGKPANAAEARAMLRRLSGRTHTVFSGLALVPPSGATAVAHEATAVTFAEMTDDEIAAYVATGSPMDKAGAYGIQDDAGALLVAAVRGCYYTVVGLPLHRLYRTLTDALPTLVEVSAPAPAPH